MLEEIENVDYIVCQICGKRFKFLGSHLTRSHNMTKEEYLELYPKSLFICKVGEQCRSKAHSGENNSMFGKKGKNNPNFGQKRPEQTKKMTGRHHTEETLEKMCGERVERIMKICPICDTEFPVLPHKADRIYCSHECFGEAHKGENNPSKRPEVKKLISEKNTGRKVTLQQKEKQHRAMIGKLAGDKNPSKRPEVAAKISASLMGHEVTEITRQKIRENMPNGSMENNGNWKGGISFKPYCEKFNSAKKKEVRDKYNNCDYLTGIHRDICNIVGGKIQELSIHHFDYNKMQGCDGHKWKLIPVSKRHNTIFNGNRFFWEKLIEYSLEYDKEYYKDEKFNIWELIND